MAPYTPPEKIALQIGCPVEGVKKKYYENMFSIIDGLNKRSEFGRGAKGDEKYLQAKYVLSNYVFLIHERLELKQVRNISYNQVKRWAHNNEKVTRYLLQQQFKDFSLEAFDKWIHPNVEMMEISMYSPSNRYNKNTFH